MRFNCREKLNTFPVVLTRNLQMQTKHEAATSKPLRFKAVVKRFAVLFKVWQSVYSLGYILRFIDK